MWFSSFRSWLLGARVSAPGSRPGPGPGRRPQPTFRPGLEALEDRTVLSPTTTTLTASVNPAKAGQPITFTATVTGGDYVPPAVTENVKFLDGTTTLATVDPGRGFQNGRAQFTTVLAPGNHSITAVFSGGSQQLPPDENGMVRLLSDDPSTSNVVSEVVKPAARGIVAALVPRKVGATRRLFVRVSFADTGALKAEVRSPFQRPAFHAVAVAAFDADGDGVADSVRLTARRGKRAVTRLLAL